MAEAWTRIAIDNFSYRQYLRQRFIFSSATHLALYDRIAAIISSFYFIAPLTPQHFRYLYQLKPLFFIERRQPLLNTLATPGQRHLSELNRLLF
jgi:hypothetical protein